MCHKTHPEFRGGQYGGPEVQITEHIKKSQLKKQNKKKKQHYDLEIKKIPKIKIQLNKKEKLWETIVD